MIIITSTLFHTIVKLCGKKKKGKYEFSRLLFAVILRLVTRQSGKRLRYADSDFCGCFLSRSTKTAVRKIQEGRRRRDRKRRNIACAGAIKSKPDPRRVTWNNQSENRLVANTWRASCVSRCFSPSCSSFLERLTRLMLFSYPSSVTHCLLFRWIILYRVSLDVSPREMKYVRGSSFIFIRSVFGVNWKKTKCRDC